MTTIRTQLGTVESARRERFEPTGTIEATNVQKAIEELDGTIGDLGGTTQVVTTGTVTVQPTDSFIYINFAGTVAVTMADSSAWLAAHEVATPLTIQDISGNANDTTNMITITRAGVDTINGGTSIEITSPFGGYKLRPPASGSWAIQ